MTNNLSPYDLIILGGGPAGVTAALRASELGTGVAGQGLKIALLERNRMGGTCTNDGCVPTRALAKAARLMRDAEQFTSYGLTGAPPTVDLSALLARTQQIVYTIQEKKQLIQNLQTSGVEVFTETGDARFVDPHTLETTRGGRFQAEKLILCVGGHARRLPFPGAEHALTHSDVWALKTLPKSVAILGAAATGCQLASIFRDFGAEVWLLELAPRILPAEDAHVSQTMETAFRRKGIHVLTGFAGVARIEKGAGGFQVISPSGGEFPQNPTSSHASPPPVEAVILAVGWPGNVEGLNLPAAGIAPERGFIPVNDFLQTPAPHIFAAGDITGRMMLVQSAGHEARIAAENAVLGLRQTYGHYIVPHGGFTDPEYGSVGLTEAQAQNAVVAVVPFADIDRAVIDGHTDGFCKLIVDRDSRQILGAHVVGEQAVEIVQLIAASMAAESRIEQLAGLELAYPTYTAIVGLAARKIAYEMGLVPLAPEWRTLGRRVAEWEGREA
ncbi:MAG: NAD(P)/FAD-dependent oxidoreductase [Anaerolineales bacterium]|nr:NAD(P)/FAD-dependent oxidoreductase [Anaerolineales bacterium]